MRERPFIDLDDDELDSEIMRLGAIDSSNIYEGLADRTVGETYDAACAEVEARKRERRPQAITANS